MSSTPMVSVIIPVFNDAERLQLCLKALADQTFTDFEVMVVDNGSDPEQQIEEVVASYPKAIYTYEPQPGAYVARNRGIRLARGHVLAFTDADCVPAPDWIALGVEHLTRMPNCGLVAGRVKLFFKGSEANVVELYESVTAFPQERLLNQQQGAATANVFTYRTVLDAVGAFNERLRSNGDIEWGQRVFAAGYRQVYAHDVCVAHPARYTFEALQRRTRRLAGGVFGRFVQPEHSLLQRSLSFARLLFDDLVPPINFMMTCFTDRRLSGVRQKLTVPLVLCWVRYVSAVEKVRLMFGGVPNRG